MQSASTDLGNGTQEFVNRQSPRGRWQSSFEDPCVRGTPAVEPDGDIRADARLAEIGADGMRLTCFVTNAEHPDHTELELRHRQRDRLWEAKRLRLVERVLQQADGPSFRIGTS
ncbi:MULTISPECIES: hypothetical protein [Streptomyces]|uniref:Uncharacterized protein n=1 Tax=Streptomyces coacervatus TaxID=647381 RepID=A0ABP7JDJ1_9ACTN|nr:hypothetical protein [Streptomyces coacervatus]MDF2264272.1 hypothetical protein [Streptomyces coacervatus]